MSAVTARFIGDPVGYKVERTDVCLPGFDPADVVGRQSSLWVRATRGTMPGSVRIDITKAYLLDYEDET